MGQAGLSCCPNQHFCCNPLYLAAAAAAAARTSTRRCQISKCGAPSYQRTPPQAATCSSHDRHKQPQLLTQPPQAATALTRLGRVAHVVQQRCPQGAVLCCPLVCRIVHSIQHLCWSGMQRQAGRWARRAVCAGPHVVGRLCDAGDGRGKGRGHSSRSQSTARALLTRGAA